MKQRALLYIFLFTITFSGCDSQTKINVSKTEDTTRIYIYGAIRDIQSKEPIPFATYLLFPTDTGGIWQGSVRRGMTDNSGNYKIDITTLVDSTTILVLRSKYINYALSHLVIRGKVKKSIPVDIEVLGGSGDYYIYYRVNPKNAKLKLEKVINKVNSPGY